MNDRARSSPTTYFAYGSNLDHAQMQERCPGARALGTARLDDFRFIINERGVATIAQAEGSAVWGGLWEITVDHLASLDRFEGVARGHYRQRVFNLLTAGSGQVTAIVYVGSWESEGLPRPGYGEKILRGAAHFGLPSDYVASLRESLKC